MEQIINYWNHIPEYINPNIIEIGSFRLRYYGLMYLVAFFLTYILVLYRIRSENHNYSKETIQNYFVLAIVVLIIGARLGYVLFYNLEYYLNHPLQIILPFDLAGGFRYLGISGMSYHGGAIGVIVASLIFCRRHRINLWRFADLLCPAIPLGYTFGRIGNFINGELYGRVTSLPWGMYFPLDPYHMLRHPSQLYEAFFEGIFLFTVLWIIRKRKYFDGFLFSLYLAGYGLVRFFIEFLRETDPQLGFVLWSFTMGQALCIIMILCGIGIIMIKKPAGKRL